MHKSIVLASAVLSAVQVTSAHGTPVGGYHTHLTDIAERDANFGINLSAPLNLNVHNMYASHGSHGSHASHSSGSGGSYRSAPVYPSTYTPSYIPTPAPIRTPAPSYIPTPAPVQPPASPYVLAPAPTSETTAAPESETAAAPESETAAAPAPTEDQLQMMIMRVQAALYVKGYDPGAIDGVLSPDTKNALAEFQASRGLAVTERMTTETLNALGISLGP